MDDLACSGTEQHVSVIARFGEIQHLTEAEVEPASNHGIRRDPKKKSR